MGLSIVSEIWSHLRKRYQPSSDSFYLSVVRQKHALQQGDFIVHEFYTGLPSAVSLTPFAVLIVILVHVARLCSLV
jgi:hypothetical protein